METRQGSLGLQGIARIPWVEFRSGPLAFPFRKDEGEHRVGTHVGSKWGDTGQPQGLGTRWGVGR